MTKVRFVLRDKREDSSRIMMIYRMGDKRLMVSTGTSVLVRYWNERTQRVKSRAEYPEFAQINAQLDAYESYFNDLLLELTAQYRTRENIPMYLLRQEFLSRVGRESNEGKDGNDGEEIKGDEVPKLGTFIQEMVRKRLNQPHKFKASSIKVYTSLLSNLNKYTKGATPLLTDVDRGFIEGFQRYLVAERKGINYINKQWVALKVVLKEARYQGIDAPVDMNHRSLTVPRKPVDNIYLNEEEIALLLTCQLDAVPSLSRVRDIFIVGCYTGLRFGDLLQLSSRNIESTPTGMILNVVAGKTNTRIKIPLKPLVYEILKKHGFSFGKISNQKANDYIKSVCQRAGLKKMVTLRSYPGGKVVENTEPKWKLVSFHTARRSFATNAYQAGIPMLNIMKITGHKKPSTFLEYIKFDEEENANLLLRSPLFN